MVKARREETAALVGRVEAPESEAVPVLEVPLLDPDDKELARVVAVPVVAGSELAVLKKIGLDYHTVSK